MALVQKERGRTRTIHGPLSQWPATGWLHLGLGHTTPYTHVTRPRPAAGSIAASHLTHGTGPKRARSYAHHTRTTLPVASHRLVAPGSWPHHPIHTCDKTQASSRVHCSLPPDPWHWSKKSEVVRAPYTDHSPSGQPQAGCTWVLATPPHT